jgi:hypothetical protein
MVERITHSEGLYIIYAVITYYYVIKFEDANVSGACDIRGGDEVKST